MAIKKRKTHVLLGRMKTLLALNEEMLKEIGDANFVDKKAATAKRKKAAARNKARPGGAVVRSRTT